MSQRAVDAVFHASFLLCEVRMILRETAPHHRLGPEQVDRVRETIGLLETEVRSLREELIP
ncbi:MAG: hypothetical protein LUO93_07835 [Methanomicrobiales archaeon]|nr:hypothetical protein [Methanomicrobiales archaeon]